MPSVQQPPSRLPPSQQPPSRQLDSAAALSAATLSLQLLLGRGLIPMCVDLSALPAASQLSRISLGLCTHRRASHECMARRVVIVEENRIAAAAGLPGLLLPCMAMVHGLEGAWLRSVEPSALRPCLPRGCHTVWWVWS